jgi:formylmethanofuran dehydrogenase subunit E
MPLRTFIFLCLAVSTTVCLAHDPSSKLPLPRYEPKDSDPVWLQQAVQLHGHLGPWVVAGVRLGMAGAKAVDAKGHFDVDVTCEGPFQKPPRSCFLDGVQLGTGATLGKRTIHPVDAKAIVLKIRHQRTGKAVEVRPTQKLMDILDPLKPGAEKGKTAELTMEQVEKLARDIAAMPDAQILEIGPAK